MNAVEYLKLGLRHQRDPFFVKYLKGKQLLDIGSGRGEFLAHDPAKFVGVDIDPELVAECQRSGLSAHTMSVLALDFADASFDVVHAAQLIEHFSPNEAVMLLSEASRVLRPGGIVFLTTPGVANVWNTFSHIRPYPPDSFRKLLKSDTENYIRKQCLNLSLVGSYGWRRYYPNKVIKLLANSLDLLIPPSNPIGWTIILRKIDVSSCDKIEKSNS